MILERRCGDETMRIGLFYPHTPIPHLHSERVAQRLPNVLDMGIRLTRDSWNTTIVTQNVQKLRSWQH